MATPIMNKKNIIFVSHSLIGEFRKVLVSGVYTYALIMRIKGTFLLCIQILFELLEVAGHWPLFYIQQGIGKTRVPGVHHW